MKIVPQSTEWPQGDTRPQEVKDREMIRKNRPRPHIQVPLSFGGRSAAESLVNSYLEYARQFDTIEEAMALIHRDMVKKAFDERTKRKYMDAIIASLEDEGIHHANNGSGPR